MNTELVQNKIELVQESIIQKKKFIDERYHKRRDELVKDKGNIEKNYQHAFDETTNTYDERLISLKKERDEEQTKISSCLANLEKCKKACEKLQESVNTLEKEVQKEAIREVKGLQSKQKEDFIIINRENIDISASIDAFKRLVGLLPQSEVWLSEELNALTIKIEQFYNSLKGKVELDYDSLVAHYALSLGSGYESASEANNIKKITVIWFGEELDEHLLQYLLDIINPKALFNSNLTLSDLGNEITTKASNLPDEIQSIEIKIEDLLFKSDSETDDEKKKGLRNDRNLLEAKKDNLKFAVEFLNKKSLQELTEKLISYVKSLRNKAPEVKAIASPKENFILQDDAFSQAKEVQARIISFQEAFNKL